ncbi:MAG TPA: hypothetical protein VF020_00925 [Chthoniobacterales bacterium]
MENQPQIDQPSRGAMAGKTSASSVESLQIYADGIRIWKECSLAEPRLGVNADHPSIALSALDFF